MEALFGFLGAVVGGFICQLLIHRQTKQFTAAERRLAAHQEAFSTWWRLASHYHDAGKRQQAMVECQEFWNSNCLYLGRRSRKAFRETMVEMMFYEAWKSENSQKLKELYTNVEGVFEAILADAALPDLHESLVDIRKLLKQEKDRA